jgi:uncharacterized protein (TIGR02246 family)
MRIIAKTGKLAALCLLTMTSIFGLEQADQEAIHGIIKSYTEAWNLRGCIGFGDGFTEDADFVNIFGMHFSGKAEIEQRHIQILKTFLKDSTMEIQDIQLREVQPGVVISLVRWKVHGFRHPSNAASTSTEREGIFTHVFINTNNQWKITASQNTLKPL